MAEEKYTFTTEYGDYKAGDTITKKQAGSEFEAMVAAGAFAPSDQSSATAPDNQPPAAPALDPVQLLDISQLTDEQVRQLQARLNQRPDPTSEPIKVDISTNERGTITQGIG